ncbi:unnamed protein product [Ectocarpus fasciculatus]
MVMASSPEDTIRANRGDSEDFGRRRRGGKKMAGRKLGGWRLGKSMTGARKRGAAAAAGMGADGGEAEKAEGPADLDSSNRSSTYSYSLRSDGGDSLTESEKRSRREGATRLLGSVKKGASVVWSKVTSDHPEPLPIDKSLTKEEWRAKHFQLEAARRNDWRTNTMGEQHVYTQILKQQEEKVWN